MGDTQLMRIYTYLMVLTLFLLFSAYYPCFRSMFRNVLAALNESQDITLYLMPLAKHFMVKQHYYNLSTFPLITLVHKWNFSTLNNPFKKAFGSDGVPRNHAPIEAVDALRVSGVLALDVLQLAGEDYRAHDRDMQPLDQHGQKVSRSILAFSGED